jgi:hypothetical protein
MRGYHDSAYLRYQVFSDKDCNGIRYSLFAIRHSLFAIRYSPFSFRFIVSQAITGCEVWPDKPEKGVADDICGLQLTDGMKRTVSVPVINDGFHGIDI